MKNINYIIFIVLLCSCSCAYFNTFYNAEQYFKKAEKIRLEKAGESIPISAIDDYSKVIEKSKRVIDDFPYSDYKMDALLLIGKSHFHRQEYRLAAATFQQFDDEFGVEFPFESGFWKAMVKWRQGRSQAALDDLNEIFNSSDIAKNIFMLPVNQKFNKKDIDRIITFLFEAVELFKSKSS